MHALAAVFNGHAALEALDVELAGELDVTRGSVNRGIQWFEAMGTEGLRTGKAPR